VPDLDLLHILLSHIDHKTLALLRFYEYQLDFLKRRVPGRLLPEQAEKTALGRLATEIGRPDLEGRELLFHPETLFRWHRELVCQKYDGSMQRGPGRPSAWGHLSAKVLSLAQENPGWGAPRIHGQLMHLGYHASEPTIWRLMRRLGLDPNPPKNRRWSDFLARHQAAIVATDFFTIHTVTAQGLRTFYALFFIQHDTRKVHLGGVTEHPTEAWAAQVARNLSMDDPGFLQGRRFLILDRDPAFGRAFRQVFKSAGVRPLVLPKESPNLNAIAERWIRSVRQECLNDLPLLPGIASIKHVLEQYLAHYHQERAHQGLGNVIPFPVTPPRLMAPANGKLQCRSRLGGLLNFYEWQGESKEVRAA
jgi:putative transposase